MQPAVVSDGIAAAGCIPLFPPEHFLGTQATAFWIKAAEARFYPA